MRALVNDKGEQIKEAPPSTPVEVLGLNGLPGAGDNFIVTENEAKAREVSDYRQRTKRDAKNRAAGPARGSLEQMMTQMKAGTIKEVPIVIKADVQGSLEAIVAALEQLGTNEVRVRILHAAVGGVSESDVILASASGCADHRLQRPRREAGARPGGPRSPRDPLLLDHLQPRRRHQSDDCRASLRRPSRKPSSAMPKCSKSSTSPRSAKVAGCRVTEGVVRRGNRVRLLRDNVVIHEGKLSTLKRFKDEVKEVVSGQECGMGVRELPRPSRRAIRSSCFEVEEIKRSL